jgi:segregation and condensation protein B
MDHLKELPQAIECLLFAAGDAVPIERLAEVAGVPPEVAEAALADLARQLEDRGLQVLRVAGGYTLGTRPEYAHFLARLREPPKERLSGAALEVLAIVAYRQPATRAEVDRVRGVDSSAALHTLLTKRLIATQGRKRAPGRPRLYGTTDVFLRAFGLAGLKDLPELPGDFARQIRQMRLDEAAEDEQEPGPGAAAAPDGPGAEV